MKPLQIGVLVLVGALGGALIMKFTQRPKPVPATVATAAPSPAVLSATPAPEPAIPVAEAPKPPAMRMTHHTQPMTRTPAASTRPTPTTVAGTLPPAQPAPPASIPQESPAAPPMAEASPAPVTNPAPAAAESEAAPAPQPAPSVTLQSGMAFLVRLGENLSSEHNQAGDTFTATLDAPISAGGFVIAEKGARVEGRVVDAQKSGRGKKAALALELTKLNTSDGQHVDIRTETFRKQGGSMATGDQVGIVAAAAGVGAIIGAMAGGGKGAAIGAGAGGAAGGGGVMATRDKAISMPTETKITFRLNAPVTITERLN